MDKVILSEIMHDTEGLQFRMTIGPFLATVDYMMKDDIMYLTHTEVPYHLHGNGYGKSLVEKTFEYIVKHNLEAIAICSFIKQAKFQNRKWDKIIG